MWRFKTAEEIIKEKGKLSVQCGFVNDVMLPLLGTIPAETEVQKKIDALMKDEFQRNIRIAIKGYAGLFYSCDMFAEANPQMEFDFNS